MFGKAHDIRIRASLVMLALRPVGKWHLGMFMEKYTPMGRGFDEHMGYYQGCESAYTHIAACCRAGSPDADQVRGNGAQVALAGMLGSA